MVGRPKIGKPKVDPLFGKGKHAPKQKFHAQLNLMCKRTVFELPENTKHKPTWLWHPQLAGRRNY